MKTLALTILFLCFPVATVFAGSSLPISEGIFYEQAVCQNLTHPKISVSTYNESVQYTSSNSTYVQVDMIVSTNGGSYDCTDSQNRYHRQSIFFAWRASTGKFTDITPRHSKPFSTIRWSGTIQRGTQHKIKAYAGNALGSLVSQNIIVDDSGVQVITNQNLPELSISSFAIAASVEKNKATNTRIVVSNTGNKASARTSGIIYVSNDRIANPHDTRIGQFSVSAIRSKGSIAVNRAVRLPVSGNKWVFACVMAVADEQDKSFSSNCSTPQTVTVTEPAVEQVAKITSPANTSKLTSRNVTFRWNQVNAIRYYLSVSTSQYGSNIFNRYLPSATTYKTLTNLPTNGRKVYVTLGTQSRSDNRWRYQKFTYTAMTRSVKRLKSLSVSCPNSVVESKSIYCRATAYYTDNSREDVTKKASWLENSSFAKFYSNGRLYAQSVYGKQRTARVTARYTLGGVTKVKTYNVTLKTKPKQLKSLRVFCPNSVVEGSNANCSARAYYTDNSNEDVTSKASWSENSRYARIYAGGRLYAYSVSGRQRSALVTAKYTVGGVTKVQTDYVTLKVKAKQFKSLSVFCPDSVIEKKAIACSAMVYYTNGSRENVTNKVAWTENSRYAYFDSRRRGQLNTQTVPSNQRATIRVSYSHGNKTVNASKYVTIKKSSRSSGNTHSKQVSRITISGPSSITEKRIGQFSATAHFTDGSRQTVTSSANWIENSRYTYFDSRRRGRLHTQSVSYNQRATIHVSYRYGNKTVNANKQVTVLNQSSSRNTSSKQLSHITINGSSYITERRTTQLSVTAYFTDGSRQIVTNSANWHENSRYTYFDSRRRGRLHTQSVSYNQRATLYVNYRYGSKTVSASKRITVLNR